MPQTANPPAISVRKRLPAVERKREVVAAVIRLAAQNGPDIITTQAIADLVGITQGALFRHFPDKDAVWVAVFDWVTEQLGTVVGTAIQAGGDPLSVLERIFLSHVEFAAQHPGVPRILFQELQRPADSVIHHTVRTMMGHYRQRIRELLVEAKTRGQLPGSLDEDIATVLFIGSIQGLVMQSTLIRGEANMLATAHQLFPLLLFGLKGAPQ